MSKILLDRTPDGIVTLTLNRPEARNALDWEAQNLFLEIIRELVSDSRVRVLIITGAGDRAFCAGGDLVELANYPSEADGQRLVATMTKALYLLENAPFPSIAAMNGSAFGGGTEIALACDLRLMNREAVFGMVQISLGLTPGWGAGQRLLRLVGYNRAMAILLEGRLLKADELLDMGLLTATTEAGETLNTAIQYARRIIGWDDGAVAAVKRVLRSGLSLPYDEARTAEAAEFPKLWASDAHWQAVNTFLRRKD